MRVVKITDQSDLTSIYNLRLDAWKTRLDVSSKNIIEYLIDEFDEAALHWAIYNGREPVASCRLNISTNFRELPDSDCIQGDISAYKSPFFMLGRLVVCKHYRQTGLSRVLISERLKYICDHYTAGTIFTATYNPHLIRVFSQYGFQIPDGYEFISPIENLKVTLLSMDIHQILL